jgi:hypothetical protein
MCPRPALRLHGLLGRTFEEMDFFFMPTLLKAKNGLENHQEAGRRRPL